VRLRDRAALYAMAGEACKNTGAVVMSYNDIATGARISRRSAIRAVAELSAGPDGWILSDLGGGPSVDAVNAGNVYRLNLGRLGAAPSARPVSPSSLWPVPDVSPGLLASVPLPEWLTAWRACPERVGHARLIRCMFSRACPDCGVIHGD